MNIREAKEEIRNTIEAYLTKDADGMPEIPIERQRPILLMGPPGIGKTAIMEQIASEMGINLVSYTITHHTRQSAIGLPFIRKKQFDGREYSVTEYTMSEIIASVYEQIERSGVREGILFLDEINCVSETLSPTMLQFLQYKTFGAHRVPEGFIVVTAGNPPEYNKSVRDLDIVTLDRVKRIDIEVDFKSFKEYAYRAGIHGSILSYLEIRGEHFYRVKAGLDGTEFVTARGWEDLSRMICVYEKLGKPVTEKLAVQYLESSEIASDYAAYYDLYNRYRNIYRIDDVLSGKADSRAVDMRSASFDEKLSLIGLMADRLNRDFRKYCEDADTARILFKELKAHLAEPSPDPAGFRRKMGIRLGNLEAAGVAGGEELRTARRVYTASKELESSFDPSGDAAEFSKIWFNEREKKRKAEAQSAGMSLTRAFAFLAGLFGEGQEIVLFLTELSNGYYSLRFVSECGNEAFYRYNKLLLLKDRKEQLKEEVMAFLDNTERRSGQK